MTIEIRDSIPRLVLAAQPTTGKTSLARMRPDVFFDPSEEWDVRFSTSGAGDVDKDAYLIERANSASPDLIIVSSSRLVGPNVDTLCVFTRSVEDGQAEWRDRADREGSRAYAPDRYWDWTPGTPLGLPVLRDNPKYNTQPQILFKLDRRRYMGQTNLVAVIQMLWVYHQRLCAAHPNVVRLEDRVGYVRRELVQRFRQTPHPEVLSGYLR